MPLSRVTLMNSSTMVCSFNLGRPYKIFSFLADSLFQSTHTLMCPMSIYLRQKVLSIPGLMPKEKHNFLFIYLHQMHVMLETPKIDSHFFFFLAFSTFSLSVTPTVCPFTQEVKS